MNFLKSLFRSSNGSAEKSEENKKRMRELFNYAVLGGNAYEILYAHNEDTHHMNFILTSPNRYQFGSYILGYRSKEPTIILLPTTPSLEGCGDPQCFYRSAIPKAYQARGEEKTFVIYTDRKHSVNFYVRDVYQDETQFACILQTEEVRKFESFFLSDFSVSGS